MALWNHNPSSLEWLAPVLFCRARNSKLFEPAAAAEPTGPAQIGVRSVLGWGLHPENLSEAFLSLTSFFRGDRFLRGETWQRDIYPTLRDFLYRVTAGEREVDLHLATHKSLTFAIGHLLEAKSGLAIGVEQRGARGTELWRITDPPAPDAEAWKVEEISLEREGPDFALAVSTSRPTLNAVKDYVTSALESVGRIVHFEPPGGPSQLFVKNGQHALRLAEQISNRMYELANGDDACTFHLFISGPNGLVLSLGRLCRGPRKVQLYEYDFQGQRNRIYYPSLLFAP